ncbi:MAG: hypothetical protein WC450_12530 [Candidatus Omnitrophota bacterium]|jgi:hypothetical protein
MEPFVLNQDVVIAATGVKGKVIATWHSVKGATQYQVLFFDTTQRPCEWWFVAEELKAA